MLFVVEVVLISRPTTTDAKDVQEPLSFSPVSVMIVGICFSDGTPREGVLPQEVGSICQPWGSEIKPKRRWKRAHL